MNSTTTFNKLLDLQCEQAKHVQYVKKSMMRKHFDDIAEASPTAKAQLKTQYGLPDNPSPLIKLHLDLYQ